MQFVSSRGVGGDDPVKNVIEKGMCPVHDYRLRRLWIARHPAARALIVMTGTRGDFVVAGAGGAVVVATGVSGAVVGGEVGGTVVAVVTTVGSSSRRLSVYFAPVLTRSFESAPSLRYTLSVW